MIVDNRIPAIDLLYIFTGTIMSEEGGSVWPEQEVIDKWLEDNCVKVSHEVSMALKRDVTDIRLAVQQRLTDLENDNPWREVGNELPVIPDGKYGVSVIVAYIDPFNAQEIDEYCTTQLLYSKARDTDKPAEFVDLATNGKDVEWLPTHFNVTHWRYPMRHPLDK